MWMSQVNRKTKQMQRAFRLRANYMLYARNYMTFLSSVDLALNQTNGFKLFAFGVVHLIFEMNIANYFGYQIFGLECNFE